MGSFNCFKAYDIRGRLGDELDEDVAYRIGRAYARYLNARAVVVGGDVRLSSEGLKQALVQGLRDSGADVIDLGMTGTEEIYFATWFLGVDGGIEVTASHNPIDYNGMKLVRENARPISADTGLKDIQALAESGNFTEAAQKGSTEKYNILPEFSAHLMGYIDPEKIRPLKLVMNAGNGAAGHVIDAIEEQFKALNIPVEFIKIHHEADGTFPNGIPNPILVENRASTRNAVLQHGADMGIAWDGDFDRCFLFDEKAQFIEGYYIVGLLAEAFLQKEKGAKIIHDPRLTWNTVDIVTRAGGTPVVSKTGHAFIKERMRKEDAVYGGEMSAHHYFRDFSYCDSGMIPWLLVLELLSQADGRSLSELMKERMARYPISGEINSKVQDAKAVLDRIEAEYGPKGKVTKVDGLSVEFDNWRFNLRMSNTEPVIRLNVETRQDQKLCDEKTKELLAEIRR